MVRHFNHFLLPILSYIVEISIEEEQTGSAGREPGAGEEKCALEEGAKVCLDI